MIVINFYWAVALFSILFILYIFTIWLWRRKEKEKSISLDPKFIWFCSVCTYTYINTKEDAVSTCPRCGSYNSKGNYHK